MHRIFRIQLNNQYQHTKVFKKILYILFILSIIIKYKARMIRILNLIDLKQYYVYEAFCLKT